jgi:periplasmic divalent cation tolerance protein
VSLVVVSVPDADVGRLLSRALVEEGLVACGTVIPGGTSVYRWQGAVEEAEEAILLLKASSQVMDQLLERISALHPYDVPEVLAFPVAQGHPPYLAWVMACCRSDTETGEP